MEPMNGQTLLNGQGHLKGCYSHEDRNMKNGSSGSNSSSPSSMPHTPYEKSKMIDITRDKPIKIAVRVAVPVRDHPKFNFVGKLLGPKGNSLKRLQEETMCKMSVLGRGSMRDRKKEEELRLSGEYKYSHLSEDLHVEIQTFAPPAEAHARIAYALAEVRRFLVPDHHDDIRQEQKWEMQALSSTQTSSNGSPDDIIEHNGGSGMSESSSSEAGTTSEQSMCSGLVENNTGNSQQHINNNTIANNNNNCDTIKNNNQNVTAVTPLEMVNDVEAVPAVALIEQQNALLRSVNIAGTLGRKRPLLCTRNINNPTKRTVMTLLARAKTANALHGFHPNGPSICDGLQLLTSPLIIPPTLEHVLQAGTMPTTLQAQTTNPQSIKQENLLQGA
ncbi:CLUMA_CG006522, isoform A [Clunio marinus]|uniref:CLUMA_CG006522, isoform A n=1 Tax=Clunio marinus TaxID=568069 RepID=A0A1J1I3J3_9DIPT|nr:CLUMA_CG006522, isoform A [Clunio marinus]